MSTDWERIKLVLTEAVARGSTVARAVYLDGACRGDERLRAEVEKLLQAHDQAGSFLEEPAAVPAQPTIALSLPVNEKPGDRIGRYKLLQQIGEGGCGVVYMAEQEEPIRRRVALKVIKLGMDTKQVIARFEAERQALALMDHPNIAKVLDAGATDAGRPYFVMELVRGIRITDYCDENQLPTEARLNLFVRVCHAIQHAHQKGIIHRDIKPSNILVTINDGVPVPKVIDFGIAKATEQRLTDKTLFTAYEQFIGTPAYMSPEQAEMTSLDIDTRSDIYALGVLLYELLTGKTPFDPKDLIAAGLEEMRRIIREQEPVRPSTRLSTLGDPERATVAKRRHSEPPQLIHLVRGDLDWIVMRCLEKDRTRRYETANGLADDLERHLQDEPVVARPPGRAYRVQKLVRRNKAVFATGAMIAAALVLGLGFSLWSLSKERAARQRAVAAEMKAQAEAAKSRQVAQFLKDMLQGVGPAVALGRDTAMLKEILDKTAERVGQDLKDSPEVEVELRNTIGEVYLELDQFAVAEAMHRKALAIARTLRGGRDLTVSLSMYDLANTLPDAGKLAEAETLARDALAVRRELLGNDDLEVARSLHQVATMVYFQNRLPEAEAIEREALDVLKKRGADKSAQGAEVLTLLGVVAHRQGMVRAAEPLYREALAIRRQLFGNEHPLLAEGLVNLSIALYHEGRLAEAEAFGRESLAMYRRLYGNEHSTVCYTLTYLALILRQQGKLGEAETQLREGLAISRKVYGNESASTVAYLADLASALWSEGNSAEAAPLGREALELCHKLQPKESMPASRDTLSLNSLSWSLERLALDLRRQKRPAEAEACVREAVAIQRQMLFQSPYDLAGSLGGLADALRENGKLAEAESVYRDGLEISRQVATNNFGQRQWLANGLAAILRQQGQPAEAESLYRETLEAARKSPQALNATIRSLGDLAAFLHEQGRLAEVEPLSRDAIEAGKKSPPSPDLAAALTSFAGVYRDQSKPAEAEPLYREALSVARQVSATNLEAQQWLAYDLALALRDQGRRAEAEPVFREAEFMFRETLAQAREGPTNNPARLSSLLGGLADALREQGKLAEAEPVFREGVAFCRQFIPENCEQRQWLAVGLGILLRSQGKLADAELFYREAVTNSAKLWPRNVKKWEWQFNDLVDVLQRQGKSNEVERLYQEAAASGWNLPPPHPSISSFAIRGDRLRDQGKFAEAEAVYREGLDICRQLAANKAEPHQWLASGLALALKNQGKLAEAEPLYREALTNSASLWPDNFKRWEWQLTDLMDVLQRQGKSNEVERLRQQRRTSAAQSQPPEAISTSNHAPWAPFHE